VTISATRSRPDGVVETCIVTTSAPLNFLMIWAIELGNAETK